MLWLWQGGNSITFIQDIQAATYPEALRYVAAKYNIEIIEKTLSPEQQKKYLLKKAFSLQPILLMNIFKICFGEQKKEKQLD